MQEKAEELLELEETNKQVIPLLASTFDEILQLGMDLNTIYILEGFSEGIKFGELSNQQKLELWKQTLLRKGYINSKGDITKDGEELLSSIGQGKLFTLKKVRQKKREIITTSFDLWWKAYPATDTFSYKGRKFVGTRALRVSKDQCAIKFSKIIAEGEYTVEEMIKALELEKRLKMEETLRVGQNKMSYFQNSLTYLNNRTYEAFIELGKSEDTQSAENQGTKRVDI